VNDDSWASMAIANEFIHLRQLPSTNVVYLDHLSDIEQMDVTEFRLRILGPVFKAIKQRGLESQIDYIVYSSDFPTAIDFQKQVKGITLPKTISPIGSITGLTYLSEFVLNNDPG